MNPLLSRLHTNTSQHNVHMTMYNTWGSVRVEVVRHTVHAQQKAVVGPNVSKPVA